MAKTIYRIGQDIYDASNNQKIADPATLQRDYSGATDLGQKPKGFTAINGAQYNTKELQQVNFNDIQPIGNTLYGIPKTPTSSDIKTGLALSGTKPPEPVFPSLYDQYANGATKTSEQMQSDLMKWFESEKTKKDNEIAQLNKEREADNKLRQENLKNASEVGQKSVDELAQDNPMLADYTSSINMKDYYGELDTQYKERKAAADEYAQTVKMMNEDLLAEQNRPTLKMFSLAKQNNLKENYTAQLSMLEARIQNADGNYAMASKTLDRGISLIQTARQDLLDSYNYIDQIYKMKDEKTGEALLSATNDQKSYVSTQIEMLQQKIQSTETEKSNIIKLLTDTQTSQTAIKAGVNITDNYDEAISKMNQYMTSHPEEFVSQSVIDLMKIANDQIKIENAETKIVKINGTEYQQNADGTFSIPEIPEETKKATELQQQAGNTAQELLSKFNDMQDNKMLGAPVGAKSLFSVIPGTESKNFKILYNNLKSLLSLDNVKYLKGQGQVSDAERKLLADASTKLNTNQTPEQFKLTLQDVAVTLGNPGSIEVKSDGTYIYKNLDGTIHKGKQGDNYKDVTKPKLNLDFNGVGGDTKKAVTSALTTSNGSNAGQCGRFVNQYTGLGLGDSYASKMSKMDKTIKKPEPGMVFVMPYGDTGHTGFIAGIDGQYAIVKDSNYSLDGKVQTHKIPLSKMTGFARV